MLFNAVIPKILSTINNLTAYAYESIAINETANVPNQE